MSMLEAMKRAMPRAKKARTVDASLINVQGVQFGGANFNLADAEREIPRVAEALARCSALIYVAAVAESHVPGVYEQTVQQLLPGMRTYLQNQVAAARAQHQGGAQS